MKSSLEVIRSLYETGDGTGYVQAVWVETERVMKLALRSEDPHFIGTIAGLVFEHREFVYDRPLTGCVFS